MACLKAEKSLCEYDISVPQCFSSPMFVKEKRLLGAGPSNPPNNVLKALSKPMMGHLHPEILKVRSLWFFNINFRNVWSCVTSHVSKFTVAFLLIQFKMNCMNKTDFKIWIAICWLSNCYLNFIQLLNFFW